MALYLEHFGLNEPPFRITPHTDFFFEGAEKSLVGKELAALNTPPVARRWRFLMNSRAALQLRSSVIISTMTFPRVNPSRTSAWASPV